MAALPAAKQLLSRFFEPDPAHWASLAEEMQKELTEAIASKQEVIANQFWFFHEVAHTRHLYTQAFQQIRAQEYYDAWCDLERAEHGVASLRRNRVFNLKQFHVQALEEAIEAWQSLYPYRVFFSPEILIKGHECGICGANVDPWTDCGHEKGKIYCGRECYHRVTGAEFLGISFVDEPVQRYSVAFLKEGEEKKDHYDYSLVKYVADGLLSPFDRFTVHKTRTYHPHEAFSSRGPEDGCPCESGRKYVDCCLNKPGVLRPHAQITFWKKPPPTLPRFLLSSDRHS